MTNSSHEFRAMIARARGGDRDALGRILERHRAYLKLLTQRRLDGRLAARLDPSDIVQQTCLSAFAKFEQFHGDQPNEFLAWLCAIHQRNVANVLRDHVISQRRSVTREQPLPAPAPSGASPAKSSIAWNAIPADALAQQSSQTSPSQRLMLGEQAVRLAAAMQDLPQDQREAVRLRYLEGRSLAEISARMQRTRQSVAGLLKRGLLQLRRELRD